MVCVWATSLDSAWGALCLTEVIDRMRLWASRILRGKIVQYVDWAYRAIASTTPNDMRRARKGLFAPVVHSKAGTSSTKGTFTSGALSGKGVTMHAADATSTPAEPIPKKRVRVKLPVAPDSKATAANKSNGSEILTRAARGASDTFINQQAASASSTSRAQDDDQVRPRRPAGVKLN